VVVDLGKDPERNGSLARSTTSNRQVLNGWRTNPGGRAIRRSAIKSTSAGADLHKRLFSVF
jgi:hypothetical protein